MRAEWNITLFHYRNHGADYGRILVGIDVPESDNEAFTDFWRAWVMFIKKKPIIRLINFSWLNQ